VLVCGIWCAGTLNGACQPERKPPPPPPPPVVAIAPATERDVPIYVEFAGTLDAYVNAEVRARVAGILVSQDYREGSFVKTGQVLFTIDPAPLRAAKLQAEGQLQQAIAAFEKADADVARYGPLVEKRAVSKEQLANAIAARSAAAGQVAAAKGALDQATLNLSYARVTSPIDGLAGVTQARVGNLVGQGTPTLLTTVSNVDPVRFAFQIRERDYFEYADRIKQLSAPPPKPKARSGDAGVMPPPGEEADPAQRLELVLAGDRLYPHLGHVAIVERQVDPTTGTLGIQALFPNPDLLLRPGMYGRVRFVDTLRNAIVVPQRAVRELQGRNQLTVIGPNDRAEVRTVKLGPTSGGFVVVQEGVKPGERVVVEGIQKVREGQPVTVKPAETSTLQLSSAPVEVPGTTRAADAGTDGGR
jgi:membrane fusion protein (multidrug efflux system)